MPGLTCGDSLSAGWSRISRCRVLQRGVSLLRTKSRDKAGTASAADRQLLTDQGESTVVTELIAKFYSLETKKIPAGRLARGDWLGCHRVFTGVGIFAKLGVRKLVSDDQGAFGSGYKGAQLASEVTLVLGSTSVASQQGPAPVAWGQDMTSLTPRGNGSTSRSWKCFFSTHPSSQTELLTSLLF